MGGGGVIRAAAAAAAKLGGLSPFTAPFRSAAAETTVAVSAKTATRPISATGTTTEHYSVQRPSFELEKKLHDDDVEDVEQLIFVSDKNGDVVDKLPRVVFGHVPSFEESMEATSELKDALDMVYFSSPNSCGSSGSVSSLHETKSCVNHVSSVPNGALQAFALLKESVAAQTVVASIASDPNVWTAVMQNKKLVEFLESDRKLVNFETREPLENSIESEPGNQVLPKNSIVFNVAEEVARSNGLMDFIRDAKITVVDMVNRLTSFVASWFSVPDMEAKEETTNGSPKTFIAGSTFMALAIMVIMVVLMKRN